MKRDPDLVSLRVITAETVRSFILLSVAEDKTGRGFAAMGGMDGNEIVLEIVLDDVPASVMGGAR